MTAQARESITIAGVEYGMRSLPLDPYLKSLSPPFTAEDFSETYCTALYRRYIGHWRVAADRLLLDRIATMRLSRNPGIEFDEFDLGRLFPGRTGPIPADWFSGKLRMPIEPQLYCTHMGWASVYRYEKIVHVRVGRVTRTREVDHTARFLAEFGNIRDLLDVEGNPLALSWLTNAGRALIAEHVGIHLPMADEPAD